MLTTPELTPLARVRSADDMHTVLAAGGSRPRHRPAARSDYGVPSDRLCRLRPGRSAPPCPGRLYRDAGPGCGQGDPARAALARAACQAYDILGQRRTALREAEAAVRLAQEAGDQRVLAHALGSLVSSTKRPARTPGRTPCTSRCTPSAQRWRTIRCC